MAVDTAPTAAPGIATYTFIGIRNKADLRVKKYT